MDTMQMGGLNGLQNLGNTCFMNSSIQCLSNIRELTQHMISNKFIEDINTDNPLGTQGKLASSYAELLKEIWGPNQKSVSAWSLKKIVSHIAPQFGGFQ
jgi:ubiquitin C-terminal hydrolase